MKHAIDPKVDCVFKALLGSPENSNLLVNFINAMLEGQLTHPITQVEILNPYNEREFISDKLSIVDVKAKDSEEQIFQIEIQLALYPSLPARILYNWADIYSQQLKSGEKYRELKASYAIWLLNDNLYSDDDTLHHFQLRDQKGRSLIDHCHITLVELKKFHSQIIHNNQERWLNFFNQAEYLDDVALPDWMNTQEMQQAMTTLSRFSEKDRAYFAYQARQEYIREQNTIQFERELEDLARLKEVEEAKNKAKEAKNEAKEAKNEAKHAQKVLAQAQQRLNQTQQQLNQTQQENSQTLKQIQLEKTQAQQEKEQAQQEKKQALTEIAELKALLAQQHKDNKS